MVRDAEDKEAKDRQRLLTLEREKHLQRKRHREAEEQLKKERREQAHLHLEDARKTAQERMLQEIYAKIEAKRKAVPCQNHRDRMKPEPGCSICKCSTKTNV